MNFLFALGLADFADFQRKGQVFGNRHMREQRIVLEHHANAALVRWNVVDRRSAQTDVTMGCGFKSCQHYQASCLARTGWAEHRQKLTPWHGKVQIFDDEVYAVIAFLHAFEFNERRIGRCVSQIRLPEFMTTVNPPCWI